MAPDPARIALTDSPCTSRQHGGSQLMVFDHVNKYRYAEKLPVILEFGRTVMPMFGFVLAYYLARPNAWARGVHGRMMCRLTLMGSAASPVGALICCGSTVQR